VALLKKKMGIKASNTAEVFFENTPVPIENVIGKVGEGFKVAMRILNNGRFGMGAGLSGLMKLCFKASMDHAKNRSQFGTKIKDFPIIKDKIARNALRIYATESMTYLVSSLMDMGSQDYELEAASLKVFASESAWTVCDESIQILGGMGFMKEPGLERILRDLRIFKIFEGTNEILRLLVTSGANEVGKKLRAGGTTGYVISKFGKMVGVGKSPKFTLAHPSLKQSTQLIEENTTHFAQAVETLVVKHKKELLNQQLALKRIANIAINLFAMSAVVSRATRSITKNLPSSNDEIQLANAFCQDSSNLIRFELRGLQEDHQLDTDLCKISDKMFESDGYKINHPVEL